MIYQYVLDISESAVRLWFDLLHGIKRMDVPLMMVLEFAILLGFDGQLDQNSDMEKELFTSAIEQLKERFDLSTSNLCFFFQILPNFRPIESMK